MLARSIVQLYDWALLRDRMLRLGGVVRHERSVADLPLRFWQRVHRQQRVQCVDRKHDQPLRGRLLHRERLSVSRREFKRDILELDRTEIERIYSELRDVKLTTYQYKTDPAASPRRLGFIIDHTKSPYPVNADGTSVNRISSSERARVV